MGKIVFLETVFYFKIENTILFYFFKILVKVFQNSFEKDFGQCENTFSK